MPTLTKPVSLTTQLQAPAYVVYEALTNDTQLCEWFCYDAQLDAKEGGRVYMYWRDENYYVMGEFVKLEENKDISFSWLGKGESTASQVHFFLKDSDGTTELTLEHKDIEAQQEVFEQQWQKGLENLKSVLETGHDLRVTEQPLIGIIPGPLLDEKSAKNLGLSISEGLLVNDILPDYSAAKAGLQKEDIITRLNGKPMTSWQDFQGVVRKLKAGDNVDLGYQRGQESVDIQMTLMPRPMPDLPKSGKALAKQVADVKVELNQELTDLFESVSEVAANHKVSSERWSANEVLAHLINTERDHQAAIAGLVVSNELEVFSSNLSVRVTATVKRFKDSQSLLKGLEDAHQETIDLLIALPESFITRKASLMRATQNALMLHYHTRHHYKQIEQAIAAAT